MAAHSTACGAGWAHREPPGRPVAGADRLPCEPRGRGREHGPPDGAGDGAEPRFEHPGHRDAHQDMQPVGVEFGVPAPHAGHGQAARAVDGDHDHERREAAGEPGWPAHVSIPCAACALGARRRGGRPAGAGPALAAGA